MNRKDLIDEAARRAGVSRSVAARGVEATLRAIRRELGNDDRVVIRGLGRLELKPKRSGFLPSGRGTGPPRPIPAGRVVRLKPTRGAVARLNDEPLEQLDKKQTNDGGNMEITMKERSGGRQVAAEGAALGLDVGTSRLVLASGAADQVKTISELNAFVTVPYSKFTETIMKQNKVVYQLNGGQSLQIFGNEAARIANVFNAEVRRPMYNGTLNPSEEYSISVMQAIIQQLVRKTRKGESLRFSVPGAPLDTTSSDLMYHEAMLKQVLDSMGYNAKSINEGLAVVFSELGDENFSGIGVSFGGGMCNVCLAFMSLPVMSFSTAKAGDHIDRSVASVTGEVSTRVRSIKEDGLDLTRSPQNKYEGALHVYYDDVIVSLVEGLRTALAETKNLPRIEKPIPIVVSGGTSKPKGFLDRFRDAVARDGFPVKISDIRSAVDPLTATARGCLIAALYDS